MRVCVWWKFGHGDAVWSNTLLGYEASTLGLGSVPWFVDDCSLVWMVVCRCVVVV